MTERPKHAGRRPAPVDDVDVLSEVLRAHPWTLEGLARAVGASRSALALRFADYVGLPPMQYLAQWRMQLAATLLAGPSTLATVAEAVGYGSEAAFSRAFKKIVGVAPASWRAMRGAALLDTPAADIPRAPWGR